MGSKSSASAGHAEYKSEWTQVDGPLLSELRRVYWDGVAREIASALVAFADICQIHPDRLPEETVAVRKLDSERLPKLQHLWDPTIGRDWRMGNVRWRAQRVNMLYYDPFGGGLIAADNRGVFERDAPDLTRRVTSAMRIDTREKRARALLQATGLLDVDIVSEYRDPVSSCLAPPPHFDAHPHVLIARQCSECRWPIRSYHFYECAEGCTDTKGCTSDEDTTDADAADAPFQRNQFMLLRHDKPGSREDAERSLRQPTPFRLCPACLHKTKRPVKHLRDVRAFPDPDNDDAKAFARELDAWEDHARGKTSQGRSAQTVDRVGAAALQRETRAPSRRIFPDGNTHATLMFGPVLIENGAGAGARISLRSPPALGVKTAHEMDRYLARDRDLVVEVGADGAEQQVVTSVEYKLTEERKLFTRQRSKLRRRFLRCEKQIVGGLFTGHDETCVKEEDDVVRCFMARAEEWRGVQKARRLTEKQRLAKLHAFAADIRDRVRASFEHRAEHYLGTFARRLSNKAIKLEWDRLRNNCQKFCNNMVFQNDEDRIYFDTQFPPVIPWLGRQVPTLPAYLMSFARDAPHGAVGKANRGIARLGSLQSSMQLHACVAHNAADAIDHAASVRYKADAAGRSVWLSLTTGTCHDDILLKAPDTTCPTEPPGSGGGACTLADHLLDCPFDNLCVLTLHAHRDMRYYPTAPSASSSQYADHKRQLTSATAAERKQWVANRLRVLHRTYALNAFLAQIARQYDAMSQATLPPRAPDEVGFPNPHWGPGSGAYFGRAWWYQTHHGPDVYAKDPTRAWPAWTHLSRKERGRAMQLTVVRDALAPHSALRAAGRHVVAAARRGAAACRCEMCLGIEAEFVCRRALGAAAGAVAQPDAPSRDVLKWGIQGLQSWLRSKAGLAAGDSGGLEDLVRRASDLLDQKRSVGEERNGEGVPVDGGRTGGGGKAQSGHLSDQQETWV